MNNTEGKRHGGVIWKLLLVVCIAAVAVLVVMRLRKPEDGVVTSPLSTVTVGKPEKGSIEIETSLIGQLEPGDVYYVTPKAAGEITEIFATQGDTVSKGDPICKIDNQKQIDSAKISLDSAKVSVNTYTDSVQTAKTNLDRMQALLSTGDISSQTYEQTKSSYDQAAAGLEAARLQVEAAQLAYDTQVEYATVTAPVSGKIESEDMELNATVSQSTELCIITGESAKKLTFSVPDRLLSALSVGETIRAEKQGTEYEGTITSVSTMVSQTTGLYPIEASIEDNGEIPSGASVKVYFISEKAENVLTVPTDAVAYDGGEEYIYTIEYIDESELNGGEAGTQVTILDGNRVGIVHKNAVTTGLSDTDRTEIVDGISETDLVIVSWTNQLYENAQVQVLPTEAD